MDRLIVTDAQRAKGAPYCLGKATDPGRTGGDGRLVLAAVLWLARTGSPWRDRPARFGQWNAVVKRFRDGVKAAAFERIFAAVSADPAMQYAMLAATIVRLHRPGAGAKAGPTPRPAAPPRAV